MTKAKQTTIDKGLGGQRLAMLGAGKIGGILLQALLDNGIIARNQTCATVKHEERAGRVAEKLQIAVGTDNVAAVRKADVIVLGVKPQVVSSVLHEIKHAVKPSQLVISVAASVPTSYIEKHLDADVPVVRAMPNTPSMLRCGMTAIAKGRFANSDHLEIARTLFDAVGKTLLVDEQHMDACTALSASGPAYIYVILESLAEAGVKVGLPRDMATLLAAQTALGAARVVLETGDHPALLKDAVTTPAGCTIDGLLELEEGGLRVTLIRAVVKATQRARELLMG
ncbi:MAG TPA: pyrroline-5-carboxylate reductase [Terriglobales bacterium]|nr:pyrroline-5-carboxylate reductase [Terriglobales bacterium]